MKIDHLNLWTIPFLLIRIVVPTGVITEDLEIIVEDKIPEETAMDHQNSPQNVKIKESVPYFKAECVMLKTVVNL
jgi:hypothetical protein